MAYLELRAVAKEFRTRDGTVRVLDGVSFGARKGEFVTLFGPNGCGKTTLLNILAGFQEATSGTIRVGRGPPGGARSYMVFQNPNDSLFNWMTVEENISIAAGEQSRHEISETLDAIHVAGRKLACFRHLYPYQLSGGLKQLAVMARAVVFGPSLLLLDEPFSSLDCLTAADLEDTLLGMWEKTRQTVIFVSHDIDEAVYLADRIVVLSNQPARVNRIVDVRLPRPRRQGMKLSGEFQRTKRKVLDSCGERGE